MAEKYMNHFYFCVTLLLCFAKVFSIEYVPLLVWDSVNKDISVPALQHLNKNEFLDIVRERLQDKPFVIVFSEENLSTEDFSNVDSSGKSTLVSLSEAIGKSNNELTYFLSVQSPLHILKKLAVSEEQITKSVLTVKGLSSEPKPKSGHFFFIEFDDAFDNENRPHLLQRHVTFMAKMFNKIKEEFGNVLVVYTGRYPSWYSPNMVSSSRIARHLLSENENPQKGYNDSHVRFYHSDDFSFKIDGQTEKRQFINYTSENSTEPGNFSFSGSFSDGQIEFFFKKYDYYWYLNNLRLKVNSTTHDLNVKNAYAPVGFSYHCTNFEISNANVTVYLPGLQVQVAFDDKAISDKFGDAYDCVGFTSVPIWSGLFVTFILVLIMTIGLCMMMDIKTMDRFDDPKGKTISVTATE